MRRVACSIVLLLGLALPAAAADPAVDTHKQAATELLDVTNVEKAMMGGATAMTDAMVQGNPMLGPYRDVILKWAASFLTWGNFGPRLVTMYTEAFTESELRDLIAFYKTPTGQKALTSMPDLMLRSAALGSEIGKAHVEELETMIRVRAAELEKQTAKP